MNDEMKEGMLLAYQSVKEEMDTIKAELKRKGIEENKGFSTLKGFIEDNIRQLNWDLRKVKKHEKQIRRD
mgnify:CR=1 FL=1